MNAQLILLRESFAARHACRCMLLEYVDAQAKPAMIGEPAALGAICLPISFLSRMVNELVTIADFLGSDFEAATEAFRVATSTPVNGGLMLIEGFLV